MSSNVHSVSNFHNVWFTNKKYKITIKLQKDVDISAVGSSALDFVDLESSYFAILFWSTILAKIYDTNFSVSVK